MGYKVGNLEVALEGVNSSALNAIDGVISKLTSLSSIVKSVTVSDLKWISSLGTRMTTLGSKMSSIDWTAFEKGMGRLDSSVSPFLQKIVASEAALKSFNEVLSKISTSKLKALDAFGNSGGGFTPKNIRVEEKALKNFNTGFSYAKLRVATYHMRRLAGFAHQVLERGSDYTETLNLWKVAMRANVESAEQFVDKMNKAFGISKTTLMQAQATFRNMIGSLGDLADETSHRLSEAITQMAVDYSSLYNVSIGDAVNKFQSALAGQVRPIRSISGYDITEKTLHALYEALGGTKTMRQLSRTEKQLLAIYAVFNQMDKSGSLGDMENTIETFANQSRIANESWKELTSWAGVLLIKAIESTEFLQYLNATLIFVGDVFEAVAISLGAVKTFGDPFENTTEGAVTASGAVDELNEKLLGFDKFRSLNEREQSPLSIDEKLLEALSKYKSMIGNASFEAQTIAEGWKESTFWIRNANGELEFDEEKWSRFSHSLGNIVQIITSFVSGGVITKLVRGIISITLAGKDLQSVLLGGVIWAIWKVIDLFEEGKYWAGAFAIIVAGALVGAFVLYKIALAKATTATILHNTAIASGNTLMEAASLKIAVLSKAYGLLAIGIGAAAVGVLAFISEWDDMGKAQKAVGIITALAGAVTALAIATHGFKGNWLKAAGIAAMVAGGALLVTSQLPKFKDGGLPDKGTVFLAGEAGAEMVYNTPSGQSGVANIQQIARADYSGTKQALQEWWAVARNDIPTFREASASGIYELVDGEANRRGNGWTKR